MTCNNCIQCVVCGEEHGDKDARLALLEKVLEAAEKYSDLYGPRIGKYADELRKAIAAAKGET